MNRTAPAHTVATKLLLVLCLLPCLMIACQPSPPTSSANKNQESGANLAANTAQFHGPPLEDDTKSGVEATPQGAATNAPTAPGGTGQENASTDSAAENPVVSSQDSQQDAKQEAVSDAVAADSSAMPLEQDEGPLPEVPASFTRIDPEQEVWVDRENKQVLVGGRICFREGALEFFACVRGSKEHESIIAAYALSSKVHLALLSIGLEPGKPVQWDPEYRAAEGPPIQIDVIWLEDGQQKERPAKEMVYNARTEAMLDVDWVFGGSRFYKDPETDQEYYLGDGGEMISVSNFSTATMDLPIESSFVNEWLLFTAKTENIPPLGTRVLLRLSAARK